MRELEKPIFEEIKTRIVADTDIPSFDINVTRNLGDGFEFLGAAIGTNKNVAL